MRVLVRLNATEKEDLRLESEGWNEVEDLRRSMKELWRVCEARPVWEFSMGYEEESPMLRDPP